MANANKNMANTHEAPSTQQYIEDIPINEMKLYFEHFKSTYVEFLSLSELTTEILQSMGIILKGLSNDHRRMTAGIVTNRFSEFDDEQEQMMTEEAVYSSSNNIDVLTMQNLDETSNSVALL